jgi:TatD DNase family protein
VSTQWPTVKREKFVRGSMVKDRQEPAHVVNIAEVLASLRGIPASELAAATYANTMEVLFPSETA